MKTSTKGTSRKSLIAHHKATRLVTCLLGCCFFAIGCSKSNEESLAQPTGGQPNTCDTANMQYSVHIEPLVRANCYSCHGNGKADGNISLDTYAKLQRLAQNGLLVGVVSHASGFAPMPQNAPRLSDCNINKIKSWVLAGAPNN